MSDQAIACFLVCAIFATGALWASVHALLRIAEALKDISERGESDAKR